MNPANHISEKLKTNDQITKLSSISVLEHECLFLFLHFLENKHKISQILLNHLDAF